MTCHSSDPPRKYWCVAIFIQKLSSLLLQTMVEVHGGANIFQRAGEFPNSTDVEYPVAPAAIDFYKNGPSFMQRHLPLWLSVHAQRAIAVLVTAIALGLPMFRFLPMASIGSRVGVFSIGMRNLRNWKLRSTLARCTNIWLKRKPKSSALRRPLATSVFH